MLDVLSVGLLDSENLCVPFRGQVADINRHGIDAAKVVNLNVVGEAKTTASAECDRRYEDGFAVNHSSLRNLSAESPGKVHLTTRA